MEERDRENCISETLKLLFEGKLKSSEFPSSLDLSAIAVDMNNLWKQSIRDIKQGIVYECAGTIVLDANGHLRLVNQIEGTSDLVSPDVKINICQRFVGTFHTHPYEEGTTGIAFRGGDIASAILGKEQISIVQSGEEVFALVRTEKTPTSVNYNEIKQKLEDIFKVYLRRGMSVQHAAITVRKLSSLLRKPPKAVAKVRGMPFAAMMSMKRAIWSEGAETSSRIGITQRFSSWSKAKSCSVVAFSTTPVGSSSTSN